MNHIIKYKLFELNFSDFSTRLKNGYVEFDSTYGNTAPSEINSFENFRSGKKRINPSSDYKSKVHQIIFDSIGKYIVKYEWIEKFKQYYFYLWSNRTHMSYKDHMSENKKTIIIDFYEDDWIFVSVANKNNNVGLLPNEIHYVCDDLDGLKNFLEDKKDFLIKK